MYKLMRHGYLLRQRDGALIPQDEMNMDFQEYLLWKDEGNIPEEEAPEEGEDPKNKIIAQIDSLERESMLNRGSRELELAIMERTAAEVAAARGITTQDLLAANVYYNKLKALDTLITGLRNQL